MSPRKIRTYRTHAIVIGHTEFGEADRMIRLFTLDMGKITAVAKGIRKIRSRKAGHLEPFTQVDLFLAKGRNLDIITQAETIDAHLGIRDDLQRVAFASYIIEVLDRFTYEEGENVGMYKLLANTLGRLEDRANIETVVHFYEMRLLDLLGFRPQLFECIDCNEKIIDQDQFFSPLAGGIACPKCGGGRPEAWVIKRDVLRFIRHLQRSKWQMVEEMVIPEKIELGLADLIERYLTYLLERKLNSTDFLREVRGRNK